MALNADNGVGTPADEEGSEQERAANTAQEGSPETQRTEPVEVPKENPQQRAAEAISRSVAEYEKKTSAKPVASEEEQSSVSEEPSKAEGTSSGAVTKTSGMSTSIFKEPEKVVDRPAERKQPKPHTEKSSSGKTRAAKKGRNAQEESAFVVEVSKIVPNPNQPRTNFDKDQLEELTASIKKDGLLQPILVRDNGDDTYQIIAGERRWQASKRAGLKKVPVRVVEADDDKVLELALIENLQRTDLNPIEEAYGYKRMMERTHKTQSEVAAAVSKGRSTVANALRLLDLPEEAQELLFENKITAGHARAILSVPSDEGRKKLTAKLKEGNLSVRETESLAKLMAGRDKTTLHTRKPAPPAIYKSAAYSLSSLYGTKVRIKSTSSGKNKIEVEFKDEEDLKRILAMMEPEQEDE